MARESLHGVPLSNARRRHAVAEAIPLCEGPRPTDGVVLPDTPTEGIPLDHPYRRPWSRWPRWAYRLVTRAASSQDRNVGYVGATHMVGCSIPSPSNAVSRIGRDDGGPDVHGRDLCPQRRPQVVSHPESSVGWAYLDRLPRRGMGETPATMGLWRNRPPALALLQAPVLPRRGGGARLPPIRRQAGWRKASWRPRSPTEDPRLSPPMIASSSTQHVKARRRRAPQAPVGGTRHRPGLTA